MKKKPSRRRVDVNVEELDRVIDETEKGPLSEADRQKLRTTLHALVESLERRRNNEKTNAVLGDQNTPEPSGEAQPQESGSKPAGHGRNGANAFRGAEKRRSHTRVCDPAIVARTEDAAMCTNRKSRKCWCGSWARRRWQLRCMNWNDCAETRADRCSLRRNRKTWAPRSMTKRPLR